MGKRHVVWLTDGERAEPEGRFAGSLTLRERNRVQVLLRAAAGDTDAEIAADLGITTNTVANVRRRFATGGLGPALNDRPRSGGPAKLDGKAGAVADAL